MRKNNMLRIASVLLVAVLLTTCAVSGVFAKYQTVGSTEDTARVAKWGVTIDATTDTIGNVMFSDSYKDAGTAYDANEEGVDITVQADTEGTNVVAPGTNGVLSAFDVEGTPEVDVKVTYAATVTMNNWENNGATCPIVFTVYNKGVSTEYKVGGEITDSAKLAEAVAKAITDITHTYDANTNLEDVDNDLKVTWSWAFGDDTASIANDTILGNNAADGTPASIAISVTATIAQID